MRTLLPLALLLLAACGFEPVYGERPTRLGGSMSEAMRSIEIVQVREREGQVLRNRLIDALTPRGPVAAPRYALDVELDEDVEGFAFRPDRAVTRERVEVRARMVLTDHETGAAEIDETLSVWTSYDIVQSDFANIAAQRDARARAAEQLADRIVARIALYLREPGA